MKKPQVQTYLLAVLGMATLVLSSCQKEDVQTPEPDARETLDASVLLQADESEWISEEIVSIGEEVYAAEELSVTGKGIAFSGFIPECVTITTVRTGTTVEKTIDFGAGCEMPNGNLLSGMIALTYQADVEAATQTLELALSGFAFNGISVEGGAEVFRTRVNANGNPQSEVTSAFEASWPEGERASWTGNRTREWVEGYGSGFWGDNVFLISGSQTFTGPAGNTYSRTVLETLRRELSCRFLVSGVLEVSRNDQAAELDFGDGSCDAFGTLTYPDGTSETVTLRRIRK
ncbi:hypothetical protein [Robiginitalea sediminis]|uniref:hypothetical protein n=1 Tax=Robiginitalea sediminis TaxID=1982593 RepID=UPI000B4B9EA2|nr:hypothetical protein [Robiginitalea sediminis]